MMSLFMYEALLLRPQLWRIGGFPMCAHERKGLYYLWLVLIIGMESGQKRHDIRKPS